MRNWADMPNWVLAIILLNVWILWYQYRLEDQLRQINKYIRSLSDRD
jgi:hypothetical protein